ncbi:serine/threonine-protein kinase PIX13 [Populus alba x Populus x berolinensis]|uniref:Serine/threonine-protein kinase PIX13 n=1 Tax=Populus alba x Populus x berolinensis TaxID=444605 RepID=A0AAD6PRM7_9ROSI|nr:serine/threonine-protein kinase PIX13 [Populus alba x Populus x berolinensis]
MGICWSSLPDQKPNSLPIVPSHIDNLSAGDTSSLGDNSWMSVGSGNITAWASQIAGSDEDFENGGISNIAVGNLKVFSYVQLIAATNNFGRDMVVGRGGFGKVYKGWQKEMVPSKGIKKSAIAVKKLGTASRQGFKQWQLIWFDLEALGTLASYNSINARIADFGLAALVPLADESQAEAHLMGTYGYAAPEVYVTGHRNAKSDVYSFGVVLVEMLTGLRAIDRRRPNEQQFLVSWVIPFQSSKRKLKSILDTRLKGKYPLKEASHVARLAIRCLKVEPKIRPSMKEIAETLEQVEVRKYKSIRS